MENHVLKVSEVERAVFALKESIEKLRERQNIQKLFEEEKVALQFSFKKFPVGKCNGIQVVLPHPPKRDACIFVKDVDKKSRNFLATKSAYDDILLENGIKDLSVIPVKDLKINYTNYESKINLTNMYELFLADSRIIRLIPSFLGSAFQKRNNYLVQVRLDKRDLKKEFERALSIAMCTLRGKGSTSQLVVGHLYQATEFLAENIVACFEAITKHAPGGLENIRNAQIKCGDSLAVPLYVSYDSRNDVEIQKCREIVENIEDDAEDVATVTEGKVFIRKGRIEIVKPGDKETKQKKLKTASALKRKAEKSVTLKTKKPKKGIDN